MLTTYVYASIRDLNIKKMELAKAGFYKDGRYAFNKVTNQKILLVHRANIFNWLPGTSPITILTDFCPTAEEKDLMSQRLRRQNGSLYILGDKQ